MTVACDYANVFEREIRPRRPLRRAAALAVWTGLFLVRPTLALAIWRERSSSRLSSSVGGGGPRNAVEGAARLLG